MPAKYTITTKGTHYFTLATPRAENDTAQVCATFIFDDLGKDASTAQALVNDVKTVLEAITEDEIEIYARQDTPDDVDLDKSTPALKLNLSPRAKAEAKAKDTPTPVITSRQAQMAYKATRKDYPTLCPHMPLYLSHKPATYTLATFAQRLADIIAGAVNEERDRQDREEDI